MVNLSPIFCFFQAFRKFVETGRVAFIAEGPEEGKLVGIVNIIDQNRVSPLPCHS